MTQEETIEQVSKLLIDGIAQLTKLAASKDQESERIVIKHYQDVVLKNLDVKSKVFSADTVRAWAQVTPEYFQCHKPRLRNTKRINSFWGVDVHKYLCDLWQRDYSEQYRTECYALNIDPKTGDFKI